MTTARSSRAPTGAAAAPAPADRSRGRVAVLGETVRVEGYGLAGALVVTADRPDEVRAAWRELPEDVLLVILTPAAAEAVGDAAGGTAPAAGGGTDRLSVVMPS